MRQFAKPIQHREGTDTASAATLCRSLQPRAGEARARLKFRRGARRSTWPLAGGGNWSSENEAKKRCREKTWNEEGERQDKRVDSHGALSPWARDAFWPSRGARLRVRLATSSQLLKSLGVLR
jgi:hypothetical protein